MVLTQSVDTPAPLRHVVCEARLRRRSARAWRMDDGLEALTVLPIWPDPRDAGMPSICSMSLQVQSGRVGDAARTLN